MDLSNNMLLYAIDVNHQIYEYSRDRTSPDLSQAHRFRSARTLK